MSYRPTDDDEKLWEYVTKGAKKFLGKTGFPKADKRPKKDVIPTMSASKVPMRHVSSPPPVSMKATEAQLNRRDMERLRKGQMEIEASLDLHGMRQEQAHHALKQFILTAITRQMRCVLVVTGKGSLSNPSVLRQNLPIWLQEKDMSPHVLKTTQAQPKDGGSGAFYIYLKKQRV